MCKPFGSSRFGTWPTDCQRAAGHSTTFTFDLKSLANIACDQRHSTFAHHECGTEIPIPTHRPTNVHGCKRHNLYFYQYWLQECKLQSHRSPCMRCMYVAMRCTRVTSSSSARTAGSTICMCIGHKDDDDDDTPKTDAKAYTSIWTAGFHCMRLAALSYRGQFFCQRMCHTLWCWQRVGKRSTGTQKNIQTDRHTRDLYNRGYEKCCIA